MWLHASWKWENAESPLRHAIRYGSWLLNVSKAFCLIRTKQTLAIKFICLDTEIVNNEVSIFCWEQQILCLALSISNLIDN